MAKGSKMKIPTATFISVTLEPSQPEEHPPFETTGAFVAALEARLTPLVGRAANPLSLSVATSITMAMFREIEGGERRPPRPAEGMALVGGVPYFRYGALTMRWKTKMYPGPRYVVPPDSAATLEALGYFEGFDLYVGHQPPLPPTLIARFGNSPEDYETANPGLVGLWKVTVAGPHFSAALARATMIGVEW